MSQCNTSETILVVMIAHSDAGQHRQTIEVPASADLEAEARVWVSGITGHPAWESVTVETQAGELLASIEMNACTTENQTCQCCGGRMPSRDIWELRRDEAGECTGSVTPGGRCHAFADDLPWVQTYRITTDDTQAEIEAISADEAARLFAEDEGIRGVRTAADLEAYLIRVGGYGSLTDENGNDIFDVASN